MLPYLLSKKNATMQVNLQKELCLFYKEYEVSRCAVIKRLKEGLHGKMDSGTLGKPFRGS